MYSFEHPWLRYRDSESRSKYAGCVVIAIVTESQQNTSRFLLVCNRLSLNAAALPFSLAFACCKKREKYDTVTL